MMKRRDHEKEMRRLLSQPPDTMRQFLQIVKWNQSIKAHNEDDREVILTSFTFLEDSLKILLKVHLGLNWQGGGNRLFDSDGGREAVLGSLYSRMILAEAVDLISKNCEADLRTLNLIRNTFAHTGHYLKFDNASLIFFSSLQTISSLGEQYDVTIADTGQLVVSVNLRTPRAKVLGFIILFWMFCSTVRQDGGGRLFSNLFGPGLPLPDRLGPQPMPDSVHENHIQEIRANPPRSSPA